MASLSLKISYRTYSMAALDRGRVLVPGRTQLEGTRAHHTTKNGAKFKTDKLFISGSFHWTYFLNYMTHQTIRRTLVLEEENRKKNLKQKMWSCSWLLQCCSTPPTHTHSEPGKLHSDYKAHPLFLPNLGGASYSPKTTVMCSDHSWPWVTEESESTNEGPTVPDDK